VGDFIRLCSSTPSERYSFVGHEFIAVYSQLYRAVLSVCLGSGWTGRGYVKVWYLCADCRATQESRHCSSVVWFWLFWGLTRITLFTIIISVRKGIWPAKCTFPAVSGVFFSSIGAWKVAVEMAVFCAVFLVSHCLFQLASLALTLSFNNGLVFILLWVNCPLKSSCTLYTVQGGSPV